MKKAFSLLEILVSLAVFGLIMASVGSAFVGMFRDWNRQKKQTACFDNVKRSMYFLSNQIRRGENSTATVTEVSGLGNELLAYRYDSNGNGNNPDTRAWFWRGKTVSGTNYGDPHTLYFAQTGRDDTIVQAYANRQEVSRGIDDSGDIFSFSGGVVTITLTSRPNINEPEGPGNKNCTMSTKVRFRS